jgi:hypothetical protein
MVHDGCLRITPRSVDPLAGYLRPAHRQHPALLTAVIPTHSIPSAGLPSRPAMGQHSGHGQSPRTAFSEPTDKPNPQTRKKD